MSWPIWIHKFKCFNCGQGKEKNVYSGIFSSYGLKSIMGTMPIQNLDQQSRLRTNIVCYILGKS